MRKKDRLLRSEKFDYILSEYLSDTEVTKAFGYDSANMVYKLKRNDSPLTEPHIKILEYKFHIPPEVFDKQIPFEREDTSVIDRLIEESYQQADLSELLSTSHPFSHNPNLLNKLTGEWYAHFYPSAKNREPYNNIKTTIKPDGTVIDKNKNQGRLFLGKKQSVIIKEAYNSENLIVITFENTQVAFGIIYFSMHSKQNLINQEMLSFGFLSRKMFNIEETKSILGAIEKQQLKIDFEFTQRISEAVQMLKEKD